MISNLTSSSVEHPVKPSLSRVFDRDWLTLVATWPSSFSDFLTSTGLAGSWENVPGVLSSSGGRDFGAFLGALAELGYGFCYRVLNAQHFGVPQRRRRVFVVGHFGDWRRAAAVLLELSRVRGDSATGGRALPAASSSSVGESDPIAFNWMEARCFHAGPVTNPLRAKHIEAVFSDRPRRFTPRECERLQGMPDDWTLIPGASNTARYKAIGNSMAVPVMRWIGEGIAAVETLP